MYKLEKLVMRIGDLCLRTCDTHLMSWKDHETAEIAKYSTNVSNNDGKEFNFTIAYWIKGSEGFDLKFVGDRPFSVEIDRDTFWKLAEFGQEYLDEWFSNEKHEE